MLLKIDNIFNWKEGEIQRNSLWHCACATFFLFFFSWNSSTIKCFLVHHPVENLRKVIQGLCLFVMLDFMAPFNEFSVSEGLLCCDQGKFRSACVQKPDVTCTDWFFPSRFSGGPVVTTVPTISQPAGAQMGLYVILKAGFLFSPTLLMFPIASASMQGHKPMADLSMLGLCLHEEFAQLAPVLQSSSSLLAFFLSKRHLYIQ